MTPTRTDFAGLETLGPGDPLSTDGYAFQSQNPPVIARLLRIGALTHRHDAHAGLADPTASAAAYAYDSGGTIPARTTVYATYTLIDADGGETLPAPAVSVITPIGFQAPAVAPSPTLDHTGGTLLAGDYTYGATIDDGQGGETTLGPLARVTIDPGASASQITLGGLAALLAGGSGGAVGASWRLWRRKAGSPWYLIATGTSDTYVDGGISGNCTVSPPRSMTTVGANSVTVTVPGSLPTDVTNFAIYLSLTPAFTSPALGGIYPSADAGVAKSFTSVNFGPGSPPARSLSIGGAAKLDAETEVDGFNWKRPVATAADLPGTDNADGDVRASLDDWALHVWSASASAWRRANGAGEIPASQFTGASYTLTLADERTVVEGDSATAQTLVVPAASTANFPDGAVIDLCQYGAGPITVTPDTGVTLLSRDAHVATAGQYATARLRKRTGDEWVLSGDLA